MDSNFSFGHMLCIWLIGVGFLPGWVAPVAFMSMVGESSMSTSAVDEVKENWMPVYSRVSWGAILAGSAVTFALYVLLNLLGVAIGLTMDTDRIGVGAAIYAIAAITLSLFVGGCVVSRCTAGESRSEAVMYGAILWGVTFFLLVWLVGVGFGMGFNAMVERSGSVPAVATAPAGGAADVGVRRDDAAEAAWWAFGGTLLSMLAAVGGAVAGTYTGRTGARHHAGYRVGGPAARVTG